MKSLPEHIILASASPARKKVLEDLGIKVETAPTGCDEQTDEKDPASSVTLLARRKLHAYLQMTERNDALATNDWTDISIDGKGRFFPSLLQCAQRPFKGPSVLTCDTMVVFEDRLIGKPKDSNEAFQLLQSFSGKEQTVVTGFALLLEGKCLLSGCDHATVQFRTYGLQEIKDYLATEEWKGAAGGYRIQKEGKHLVERTIGDIHTVVGLPLFLISALIGSNFVL
ncbi:MAG: Maf family protein [Spirochaetia bacterium]|jgi:septum formation protein|nr:Maf family protein [Spirochaetia bacterium]